MADKNPSTSLTISFSTVTIDADGNPVADASLSAEVNSEDNGGKTNFIFGDSVVYRVYKSSNISSLSVIVSDGRDSAVASNVTGTITDEIVSFSGSNEASTSKLITALVSSTAMGISSLGAISQNGINGVKCSKVSAGPTDPVVGVCKITYNTQYMTRRLYNVAQPEGFGIGEFTSYPVLIYIVGVVL